jgi:glycosyltransferase involved in cell wall biosynthesis
MKLLVIDTSYSYEKILKLGLQSSVLCRDLDGYFEHVWTIHPFASLVTSSDWGNQYGRFDTFMMSKNHTFIEGKIGRFKFLRFFKRLNFFYSQLGMLIYLIKLIKKEKISVLRVGDPLYLGILGFILSRINKIPFVVRVGSNNDKIRQTTGRCMMPRFFNSIRLEEVTERFIFSKANLVAGANYDNLNFALNNGANPNRCTLFRYGNLINPVHFIHPANRISIRDNFDFSFDCLLLCIARLDPVKKVDDVIKVTSEVKRAKFRVKTLIVGDGCEKEKLINLAKSLSVFEDIIFCGNKDQEWIANIIPEATVVLSPHTGRALTEVALGGAPIVAYDIDWQSEIIESGFTGELIGFGDSQAFANATIKLLKNRVYALELGSNVREKVLKMMDPFILNEHERDQYNKLLNN